MKIRKAHTDISEAAAVNKATSARSILFATIYVLVCALVIFAHMAISAQSAEIQHTQAAHHQDNTRKLSPVITYEDGIYSVFDSNREEHQFQPLNDGQFSASNANSGSLRQLSSGDFLWTDTLAKEHRFIGSFTATQIIQNREQALHRPTIKQSDLQRTAAIELESTTRSQTKSLKECVGSDPAYSEQPVVTDITDDSDGTEGTDSTGDSDSTDGSHSTDDTDSSDGTDSTDSTNSTNSTNGTNGTDGTDGTDNNDSDGRDEVDSADGAEETITAEPDSDEEASEQCDTDTQGPHTFLTALNTGAHTTLDARPESCQSYFVQYYSTRRGFEIEAGLHLHAPYRQWQPTLRTFPVIDFISESALYVVNSRDLGSRTFNSSSNPEALFDQLLEDGETIQTRFLDVLQAQGSISASELGQSTTITLDELRPVTLQLVIRDGLASTSHWDQIARAREQLFEQHGIVLEVLVIP